MLKWLGLGLLLAAGFGEAAWAQTTRFDGQYVGTLTLGRIISGECTTPPVGSEYPLTVAGGQVRFKYVPRFDTLLSGRIDDNGAFKAIGRTKHGVVTMTGRIEGAGNVTATIVGPSCAYNFQTKN
jgi:hypothetical protein